MRKYLLIIAVIIAALFVFNACVAEAQQPENTEESTTSECLESSETISATPYIYNALSTLFDETVESSFSTCVEGVVVHTYNNVVLIQDLNGKAGLRVELKDGETIPNVGSYIKACGVLEKYKNDYKGTNVITFKLKYATETTLEDSTLLIFKNITDEFFDIENNYKLNTFVGAEGTVTKVYTGDNPAISFEISLEDSTKSIIIYSFDNDVRDWIKNKAKEYEGSKLCVKGYWSKFMDDWEIIPRTTEDIPAIGE